MVAFWKTTLTCLLTMLCLFVQSHAWNERDTLEDMQDEISFLRDELGTLNTKMDILLQEVYGHKVSTNISEPKWPPLSLVNVSKQETDEGIKTTVFYQTFSTCDDITVSWVNYRTHQHEYLKEQGRSCSGETPSIGSTSVVTDALGNEPQLNVATNNGLYGHSFYLNRNITSNYTIEKISADEFFVEEANKTVTYHEGEPVVLNVLYRSPSTAGPPKFSLRIQIETISKTGGNAVFLTDGCSINPYNDDSKACRLRRLQKTKSYFRFQIHIDTTLVKPVGYTTIRTDPTYGAGQFSTSSYQILGIHEGTQADLYPDNFVHLSVNFDICTFRKSCYFECQARGQYVETLKLSEINKNGTQEILAPEFINKRPYFSKGIWLLRTPAEAGSEKHMICSVTYPNGTNVSRNYTVVFNQPPSIVRNMSSFTVDFDAKMATITCAATGTPMPFMRGKLELYESENQETASEIYPIYLYDYGDNLRQVNGTFIHRFSFSFPYDGTYYKLVSVTCSAYSERGNFEDHARLETYNLVTHTKINDAIYED
ncbi:uncharacterized protein LOC101862625 [Aplysia californica]|uniref:Uncharacterized protein LOC101862625 n=1 Tax=Aplysia californica TaxID=6500 RepID=A0ABM0JC85_APLCA|nr:uncharacterized protein LOC101862625 [Aplysia californica]